MQLNSVLVVYYVHNYNSLQAVQRVLHRHNIPFTAVRRAHLRSSLFKERDLIITVGGDGTLLRASQFVLDTPVLAVTSDVHLNEGFFTRASKDDFAQKLARLLRGRFKIIALTRLEAIINKKKKMPLAVNEVFIGSRRPYHTSLYTVCVNGRKEFQKSSGVLVYTAAGSHGWAASAGARRLPLVSRKISYLVREAYRGRLTKPKLIANTVTGKLTVKSSIHDGIVVTDSSQHATPFTDGDVIEIRKAKQPLRFVTF